MDESLSNFDALWDYHDPVATEAKFRALLPAAQESGDRSHRAQLLTQIARAQGLQHKFDEAHATLDEVERMLQAMDDAPAARVRYLLERGRVVKSSGPPERARPLFNAAYEDAVNNALDACAIDAAHMIAIVEPDPAEQLRWNLRAMDLAERSGDERARRWRASLYNNIGWTYFEQGDYGRAMEVFTKAVNLREEMNQPRELRIARYCVAKTLRMQGRLDEAMQIARALIAADGESDGYFHEELGECLLATGDAAAARPHFRRAHEVLSQDPWLSANEPQRLGRLKQLGS